MKAPYSRGGYSDATASPRDAFHTITADFGSDGLRGWGEDHDHWSAQAFRHYFRGEQEEQR